MWSMIWPLLLIVLSNCFYNICLAVALLIIGFLLFKETITIKQLAGVVVCGVGLFLINGK
ncbi:MAG: hypothetical protein IKF09_07030 [Clostridiales bacterium]|nr:hypothetical protein [Clostridiales bacterium]